MRKWFLTLILTLSAASPLWAQATTLIDGGISTAGANCSVATRCVDFDVRLVPSIGVYVKLGVSATVQIEASLDAASMTTGTWFSWPDDVNVSTTISATGAYFISNPGFQRIRLRASAISGALTVRGVRGTATLRSTAAFTGSVGADGALVDGASSGIRATIFSLTNSHPLAAQIVDASGTAITSFGGGTQYAEGATAATPTGTAMMFKGAANAMTAVTGTAAAGINVNLTNASLTVASHAVTNAGTFATQATQAGTWNIATLTTLTGITNVVHVDDNGGTLSIDDGGGSITVDGSISCSNCSGSGASAVDNAAFTVGTGSVAPAGFLVDQTTPGSVTEDHVGLARMLPNRVPFMTIRDGAGNERGAAVDASGNLQVLASGTVAIGAGAAAIGTVGVTSISAGSNVIGQATVALTNSTTNTATYFPISSALSDNATNVKASPGNLYGAFLVNTTSTLYYLKMYNTSASPTGCTATNYAFTMPIPPSNAGFAVPMFGGVGFPTGLSYCITGGGASNDDTSAATGIFGFLSYK